MKKCFLFTILFIIGTTSFIKAQNVTVVNRDGTSISYRPTETVGSFKYSDVKGSPYTSMEFQEATCSDIDEPILVRYDAYKQTLQFKDQDSILKAISPQSRYRFDLKDKDNSYIVVNYPDYGLSYGLLLWENSDGMRLIKKQVVKYDKGRESDGSYKMAIPASFGNVIETFYIQKKENAKLIEIPSQKKKAFKLLGNDFENNAKESKLNVKKEEELIKLLKLTFNTPK
ncbi:hypothetical protein WAF17_00755 [Bernardetia sp. ABR2-2B]|uniref:hypothetical protein n=1 Tax=Bernardetia sp. ABR2-2B TaxID=3127472 RepID=UPI0030D19E38